MAGRAFSQVDVFTSVPFKGNPVAVVLDAGGIDDETMQAIARWTNLSETTFVLPAGNSAADYRCRIFTPRAELPFAGHPTLGTAHALLEAGLATPRQGKLVQQCVAGLIEIAVPGDWRGDGLSLTMPPHRLEPVMDPAGLARALGISGADGWRPQAVNVGPTWIVAELADGAAVAALSPDMPALAAWYRPLRATGVTVFGREGDGLIVRSFAPADGIDEDPVCGSGNGAAAAFRLEAGQIGPGDAYIARQGMNVGRDGSVRISVSDGGRISIGGRCVACIRGTIQT